MKGIHFSISQLPPEVIFYTQITLFQKLSILVPGSKHGPQVYLGTVDTGVGVGYLFMSVTLKGVH